MKRVIVIVAAGSGTRAGDPDKVLLPIGDDPLISFSLNSADAISVADCIIVVTRQDLIEEIEEIIETFGVKTPTRVIEGGATRTESVRAGVAVAAEAGAEIVAIHDAARPFVAPDQFKWVIDEAAENGGAIIATPVTDTLKRVNEDARIVETVDRTDLWMAQTPQAFKVDLLLPLLDKAIAENAPATDEASLFEAAGHPVVVMIGDRDNIKLTYPEDYALMKTIFDGRLFAATNPRGTW